MKFIRAMRSKKYVAKRNTLIPEAEAYANETVGRQVLDDAAKTNAPSAKPTKP